MDNELAVAYAAGTQHLALDLKGGGRGGQLPGPGVVLSARRSGSQESEEMASGTTLTKGTGMEITRQVGQEGAEGRDGRDFGVGSAAVENPVNGKSTRPPAFDSRQR